MIVLALVGVVLLQRSEGGGLGIGGGSGFMTARGAANTLTRATAILAAAFFVTSLGFRCWRVTARSRSTSSTAGLSRPGRVRAASSTSSAAVLPTFLPRRRRLAPPAADRHGDAAVRRSGRTGGARRSGSPLPLRQTPPASAAPEALPQMPPRHPRRRRRRSAGSGDPSRVDRSAGRRTDSRLPASRLDLRRSIFLPRSVLRLNTVAANAASITKNRCGADVPGHA